MLDEVNHLAGARDGRTPLTAEEIEGLIPSWIATQGDLDRAEQDNISAAVAQLTDRRLSTGEILTERFVRSVHRQMFGDVWRWAGRYRSSDENLGVAKERIVEELAKLLDDAGFWIEQDVHAPDEVAVRFHHKLVWIHPFANGNGRLSRLTADLLAVSLDRPPFTWGETADTAPDDLRTAYISALQALDADPTNASRLIAFARE